MKQDVKPHSKEDLESVSQFDVFLARKNKIIIIITNIKDISMKISKFSIYLEDKYA